MESLFYFLYNLNRSNFIRQCANLWNVKHRFFEHISRFQDHYLQILDSMPVEVCKFVRAKNTNQFKGTAAYGKWFGQTFFGFRLHLKITDIGVIRNFILAPANEHDVRYIEPLLADDSDGWTLGETGIFITKTGVVLFGTSVILMIGLYIIVQRTKLGRAMRSVAEDKQTAALMGMDVDRTIALTFLLGSALGGAGGVMLGFHNTVMRFNTGFIPGLKAFTAAVLGGIGNVPGAMVGSLVLGVAEALGPSLLGFPTEYKDVIAFTMLVLLLIFRPTGILGEVLSEKKA